MSKLKKGTVSTLLLVLVFLVGLSLLLYPTVSDYWNSFHQSKAIAGYTEKAAKLNDDAYETLWENVRAYNETLLHTETTFRLTDEKLGVYNSLLSVTGTDVIGYIEIDKIHCSLPIYHGADDAVLQTGVGHLAGSSLPAGGESTHCVLSAHRGLPSAKLFTNLDKLVLGDTFVLSVLDQTLTYEVDQIRVIEPNDTDELRITKGEDYCTLMTCTPYGINTHRLLVRGHRIENAVSDHAGRVPADAVQLESTIVAPLVAAPILLLLLVGMMIKTRNKKRVKKDREESNPK